MLLLLLSLAARAVAGVPQAEEQAGSAQYDDEANVMDATKALGEVDNDSDDSLLLLLLLLSLFCWDAALASL